ncbi:MAG: hypothetical protein M1833_004390 [Piccolia ochrophora]|nr:MAG: hypothetical protein M1833_004390 [Piccolia ochrophora]
MQRYQDEPLKDLGGQACQRQSPNHNPANCGCGCTGCCCNNICSDESGDGDQQEVAGAFNPYRSYAASENEDVQSPEGVPFPPSTHSPHSPRSCQPRNPRTPNMRANQAHVPVMNRGQEVVGMMGPFMYDPASPDHTIRNNCADLVDPVPFTLPEPGTPAESIIAQASSNEASARDSMSSSTWNIATSPAVFGTGTWVQSHNWVHSPVVLTEQRQYPMQLRYPMEHLTLSDESLADNDDEH